MKDQWYAVIHHTFELDIPEPKVKSSQKSVGRWVHKVWTVADEESAFALAMYVVRKDPLLQNNEDFLKLAGQSLAENNYYAVGRETISIAKISDTEALNLQDDDVFLRENFLPKIHLTY